MTNRDLPLSAGRVLVFDRNLSGAIRRRQYPHAGLLRIMGIPTARRPGQRTLTVPNEVGFISPTVFMIGGQPRRGRRRQSSDPFVFPPFWRTAGVAGRRLIAACPGTSGRSARPAINPPANRPNRDQGEPSERSLNSPERPRRLAGNELFVVDAGNHRVLVFPAPPDWARARGRTRGVRARIAFYLRAPNLTEGREFQFVPISAPSA